MPLLAFDHVNLRTAQLDAMIAWYGDTLDMHPGDRPNFPFPGAWLYLGDQALVHLIGVNPAPLRGENLTLEHFSLSATGLPAFLDLLEARGEAYELGSLGDYGFDILQVNIHDPDRNHIHIDFPLSEYAG